MGSRRYSTPTKAVSSPVRPSLGHCWNGASKSAWMARGATWATSSWNGCGGASNVYLEAYEDGTEAKQGIESYLDFYNRGRPHQALGYRTP
jgi:hypothetical protein